MRKRYPVVSLEKMQAVDAEIAACVAAGRDPLELIYVSPKEMTGSNDERIGRLLDEWPKVLRDRLAVLIVKREAAAVERYKTEFQPEAEADERANGKDS